MKSLLTLFFIVFYFACSGAIAQEIRLVAMNSFQPFVIPGSESQPTGIAVEVVYDLFRKADIKTKPVELFPLKRTLNIVSQNSVTFGFPLFRTPEREEKYKWVVPVTLPIRSVLAKLKSRTDISINILTDARKYSIGVVNGNNLQTLLVQSGFKKIDPVTTNEQNYRKLFSKRIDLISIREPTLLTEIKKHGFSTDDIEIAFSFGDDSPGWLIANPETPEEIIIKLQKAYETVRENNLIEKITRKYY